MSRRSQTVPGFPAPPGQTRGDCLRGVLGFLEGPAPEWTVRDLLDWFSEHLVGPGLMKRPQIVREPGATPVALDVRAEGDDALPELLTRARSRVLDAVRGLIAPIADDRFLNAAIYGGRVRRSVVDGRPAWVASPREIDFLGDIVLSLLAADVLVDREFYRTHLALCDVCARVTFKDNGDPRTLCSEHRSAVSGFTAKVR